MLEEYVSIEKASNSVYQVSQLLDWLSDGLALGKTGFEYIVELKNNSEYLITKGLKRFSDESTIREMFSMMNENTFQELQATLVALLKKRAALARPKFVWVDNDDTVVTLYGSQEKGELAVTLTKGRRSYRIRVATIHSTREVVALELLPGNDSSHEIVSFFNRIAKNLPSNYVLEEIKADSSFFSEVILRGWKAEEWNTT